MFLLIQCIVLLGLFSWSASPDPHTNEINHFVIQNLSRKTDSGLPSEEIIWFWIVRVLQRIKKIRNIGQDYEHLELDTTFQNQIP